MELNYLHLRRLRVAVVDNYDSFTFNLVQLLERLGAETDVFANDGAMPERVVKSADAVLLSPGPGGPEDAGICKPLVKAFAGAVPILGVCLGHQVIAECFGARVEPSPAPLHGKCEDVLHPGDGLFAGLPSPFRAARYNSLGVVRSSLPAALQVTAWSRGGEIMAFRHLSVPLDGIQFHPESILSEHGPRLIHNWLSACCSAESSARGPEPEELAARG